LTSSGAPSNPPASSSSTRTAAGQAYDCESGNQKRPRRAEAKVALERWYKLVKTAHWASTDEVQRAAPKSKVLNRERIRFEVAGGNYRLVVAFDFHRQVAFVKFIGTHAEYDRGDVLTISQF